MREAEQREAAAVVLQLYTPGGLDSAILYAAALAAMVLGANLGAATPVGLFGPTPLPEPATESAPAGGNSGQPPANAPKDLMTKVPNDFAAYIRALAVLHGRNADWAEKAVREAVVSQFEIKIPGAMQLRYLATLSEIASERSSTIVFPFPLDLVKAFSPTGDHRPP